MNELGTTTLETERLILRRFEQKDIPNMYTNWVTDPETSKMLNWNVHESIDVTKEINDIIVYSIKKKKL